MKVLLVDDDPLILQALQSVVRGLGEDVTVIGVDQPADAHKLLQRESGFDLMLLNLVLGESEGDADGFEVLATMRRRHPGLPVVVVTNSEEGPDAVRAIDMGAMGFVPKRSPKLDVRSALAMVMVGGVFIPPGMLGLVRAGRPPDAGDTVPSVMRPSSKSAPGEAAETQQLSDGASLPQPDIELPVPARTDRRVNHAAAPKAAAAAGRPPEASPEALPRLPQHFDSLGLTPRQTEVLALMLRGLPNKLIARELSLSVDTIKDHVAAVLRVLGVANRTQAVLAVSRITLAHDMPGWRAPEH